MDRIVDIATDGLHLSAYRGFLIVKLDGQEQGRIALDDICAVIVHAHGVTWTTSLAVELARRGAIIVLCAANHAPVALISPIDGHHAQAAKMRAQWDAPRPLMKQLWRQIVVAKIEMQASLLFARGRPEGNALAMMARRVRSGDAGNLEAQAARRYWPALMGTDFRRDQDADGANALLNYGYTIMRSCVARSIVAAGLHPTIGLHHHNRLNGFALADDLVEPFRPLVDNLVQRMADEGVDSVTSEAKLRLARLIGHDVRIGGNISPVSVASQRMAQSLARSFEDRKQVLTLFEPPDALSWASFGQAAAH
ncbi:CRISPR-associated protein Cas1 [Sphingobium wenxiniae]|uniref:CRISPR-associated endonuclease Cas1 n=1 Tax=Sphingobium wenxiniae (strain DSM 21828 / CGMCC 1.7748 / JZ-1) TaxID=595605 RepID=A0A562K2Q8_SPHWJ|nr:MULTISPECIES: type II CRISPR-associated endonuclease Cas1 [Sphingobium]MBB6193339.1 CRISPR-associated protein Cas1 [Sphingobium wenxiniae]TWH89514.1 CRISPR-associated protein Cas1 [Sphingobium wenxiniae]WRD78013.1 type II CRISPR-associated endonuclease Cas1 [Sphingobium baderi]